MYVSPILINYNSAYAVIPGYSALFITDILMNAKSDEYLMIKHFLFQGGIMPHKF